MHRENLIFDVGAHRGQDAEYYLKKGYRVVAVEAEPVHVAFMQTRFPEAVADGRLTIVGRAIAAHHGEVTFYRNKTVSVYGTVEPEWAKRNIEVGTQVEEITVDSITAQELFSQYGIPFYLKVDIEGSDLLVLEALKGFLARPPYLSIESDSPCLDNILRQFSTMKDLGYEEFKIVPQHLIQDQRSPMVSAHGNSCIHKFEPGSSGLFGEDIEGPWLSASEAIANYKGIVILEQVVLALRKGILSGSCEEFMRAFGHRQGWHDTHTRHSSAR